MNYVFSSEIIKRIIEHWLATPPNGYLGYRYGRNLAELLFHPMNEDRADILLSWIKKDIPIFRNATDGELSVVSEAIGIDQKRYYIQFGEIQVLIPDNQGAQKNAESF